MSADKQSEAGGLDAVIFDLDGVLVWSIPVHFEAFQRTFASVGREFSWADYMKLGAGASRELLIRRVMGDEIEQELFDRLMREKVEHVQALIEEKGLEPIEGARAFVEKVLAAGLKTAVATASRTPDLLLRGAGMGDLFEVVLSRDDVEKAKPAPDIFLLAAERLGVSPQRSLVLEDSPLGIEAGVRAGMRVIALTTSESADRLGKADVIVDGFASIDLSDWT